MEQKFCQSCGMPLNPANPGTNADGSISEDYCGYCYKDGVFLQDFNMSQMIEFCVQFYRPDKQGNRMESLSGTGKGSNAQDFPKRSNAGKRKTKEASQKKLSVCLRNAMRSHLPR